TLPRNALSITVQKDGTLSADGQPAGRLQVTRFGNPASLAPVGTSLFRAPDEAGAAPSQAAVLQGVREQSNVQPAGSMATLVKDMRFFEASQRALKALSDATQMLTRPGGS
ncbi:MAG: hypothetical protein K2W96_09230, partial [Gemmataceae bacterium]|nr:hypothetical protein [Gemmataceae bacterium]